MKDDKKFEVRERQANKQKWEPAREKQGWEKTFRQNSLLTKQFLRLLIQVFDVPYAKNLVKSKKKKAGEYSAKLILKINNLRTEKRR